MGTRMETDRSVQICIQCIYLVTVPVRHNTMVRYIMLADGDQEKKKPVCNSVCGQCFPTPSEPTEISVKPLP